MNRERPFDVPPEPIEVDERSLLAVLQSDLVAVPRQQMGGLVAQGADADRLDLQEGIIVRALIDVTISVAKKLILRGIDRHLLVLRVLALADRTRLGTDVQPLVPAGYALPLPPKPPHGVDPPLPLSVSGVALLPDRLQLEGGGLHLLRRSGDPVEHLPGAVLRVDKLRDVQPGHVPVGVGLLLQQVSLNVPQDAGLNLADVCEPFERP